jgi:hypothetical protein
LSVSQLFEASAFLISSKSKVKKVSSLQVASFLNYHSQKIKPFELNIFILKEAVAHYRCSLLLQDSALSLQQATRWQRTRLPGPSHAIASR